MINNKQPDQKPEDIKQINCGKNEKTENDIIIAEKKSPKPTKNIADSERKFFFEKVALFINGSIALFAFITLIFVWQQTSVFKAQLLNQSRAWVTVKDASYSGVDEGKTASAKIVFINSGNTPALNVKVHNNIGFRSEPFPDEMPLTPFDETGSISVIGPQSVQTSSIPKKGILQPNHVKDFKAGSLRLYVWGVIKYDDIFGNQRETRYCMVSENDTNAFNACKNGNYTN